MGQFCEGADSQITPVLETLEDTNLVILMAMDGFCAIVTVATTVYLFGKRNS